MISQNVIELLVGALAPILVVKEIRVLTHAPTSPLIERFPYIGEKFANKPVILLVITLLGLF